MSTDEIDRLLARGYMGGPRRDRILDEVLARTASPAPTRAWRWSWFALVPALGAGIALWMIVARPDDQTVRSKGSKLPPSAVDIRCRPDVVGTCRTGENLMFEVQPRSSVRYLTAYAVRVDDPHGARIWYFPRLQGVSPAVSAASHTTVLPQGIAIGPEHPPGTYRVTVLLSGRPLSRAEVDRDPVDADLQRTTLEMRVIAAPEP